MKPVFWYRGRFSWTAISLLVYSTLCVLMFDYVWRRIEVPFIPLFLCGIVAWVIGNGIVLAASRQLQHK